MLSIRSQVPAEGEASAEAPNATPGLKDSRKVILAMLLTLCLGLLLASVYLGGRISATHAAASRAAAAKQVAAKQVAQVKPRPVIIPPAAIPMPSPALGATALPVGVTSASSAKLAAAPKPDPAPKATAAPPAAKLTAPMVPSAPAAKPSTTPMPAPAPAASAVAKNAPSGSPAPATKPAAAISAPSKAASATPAVTEPVSEAELVHPKPGDAYVQVGAFAAPYVSGWVSTLEGRGFHPIVADGPNAVIHRVLIGPLRPAEVNEVEAKLREAGIEHFEKIY